MAASSNKIIELKSPIFALFIIDDILIVSSGGGNTKFGLKNKLLSFKVSNNGITQQIHEEDMGNDIATSICGLPLKKIFCISIANYTKFYTVSSNGKFNSIHTLQTLNESNEDLFQTACSLTNTHLGIGTSNGIIKVYNVKFQNNEISSIDLLKENKNAHIRNINNMIIIPNKKLLLTVSGDGSCKMFELTTIQLLKKVSFRMNIQENSNYFMRDLAYDKYSNVIYTLQSPLRGKSFITKWNVYKNLEPIETVEVSNVVCSSMTYSEDMGVLGVTDSEGGVLYVDAGKNMKVIKRLSIGENMIKCGGFYRGKFVSGSVDNFIRLNNAYEGSCCSFSTIVFLILICLFGYRVYDVYMKDKVEKSY